MHGFNSITKMGCIYYGSGPCLLDFWHPGVDLLDTALPSGNSLPCISYILHKKFPWEKLEEGKGWLWMAIGNCTLSPKTRGQMLKTYLPALSSFLSFPSHPFAQGHTYLDTLIRGDWWKYWHGPFLAGSQLLFLPPFLSVLFRDDSPKSPWSTFNLISFATPRWGSFIDIFHKNGISEKTTTRIWWSKTH